LFSNRAGDAHRSSALGAPWSAIGNQASAVVMMVEWPELVVPDRGGRASAAALLAGWRRVGKGWPFRPCSPWEL